MPSFSGALCRNCGAVFSAAPLPCRNDAISFGPNCRISAARSAFTRLSLCGEGKLRRLVGVATDITERKRTEEALRENEHSLLPTQQPCHGRVFRQPRFFCRAFGGKDFFGKVLCSPGRVIGGG
jgi:hypothetical protein